MTSPRQSEAVWAIFGLGNPGKQYANTRHNLGFRVIDRLSSQFQTKLRRPRGLGVLSSVFQIEKERAFLVKPLTFVNNSGKAVKKFVARHKIPFSSLLIICDDINLPLGTIRIRKKGSGGGQHGLESIIEEIGTTQFPRLRLGISPPDLKPAEIGDLADFVLSEFEKEEAEIVYSMVERAGQAVEAILKDGIEPAMNVFNRAA